MARDHTQSPTRSKGFHHEDAALVRAIHSGSVNAWHDFLDRYSGLVFQVVRRHLFAADEDDVRTVYVEVLKNLYEGALDKYEGRSSLATWLIVFARNRSLDFFRRQNGRDRPPRGQERLSDFDRRVLKFYFVDRVPIEITIHMLQWAGYRVSAVEVAESIRRVEATIDPRYLRKLDDEHLGRKRNGGNARMLKCLMQMRIDQEAAMAAERPDARLMAQELTSAANRVRELLDTLPADERRAIDMRFRRGLTAIEIADELGLEGQRRAYTVIARAIRRLRARLGAT